MLTIAEDQDCFAAEEGAEGDGKAVELYHDKPAMRMMIMMMKMRVGHVTLKTCLVSFQKQTVKTLNYIEFKIFN